jgi:hypothetical protein
VQKLGTPSKNYQGLVPQLREVGTEIIFGRRQLTKKTCTVEGCTNPARARGLCSKHLQQQNRRKKRDEAGRFVSEGLPPIDNNHKGIVKMPKRKGESREDKKEQAIAQALASDKDTLEHQLSNMERLKALRLAQRNDKTKQGKKENGSQ